MGQLDLGLLAAQIPLARHVIAEGYQSISFCRDGSALPDMVALRTLKILHVDGGSGHYQDWCVHWCELMGKYYEAGEEQCLIPW